MVLGGEVLSQSLSYRMVMPPGWIRLDVNPSGEGQGKLEQEISALTRFASARLEPKEAASFSESVAAAVRREVDSARSAGVVDLYMLIDPPGGVPIDASFVISIGPAPIAAGETLVPSDLGIERIGKVGDTDIEVSRISIGGQEAWRVHTLERTPTMKYFKRRDLLEYLFLIDSCPASPRLTFSLRSPDEAGAALTLCDGIASTFKWNFGSG